MGQNVSVPTTKPCSKCREWGDQDVNTVKVDITKLSLPSFANKEDAENLPPANHEPQVSDEEKQRILEEAWKVETQRRHQEWEEKQRRSSRQRQLLEQERQEQKRQQLQMQAEAFRRQKEEEERKQREMEELRLREEREEEEKQQQEAKQRAEEAKANQSEQEEAECNRKLEEIKANHCIQAWLQSNSFAHVNDLQRKRFTKVRPLHMAVQINDAETVTLLMKAGADRNLMSSKRETPMQLALRLNKAGSHNSVMSALAKLPET